MKKRLILPLFTTFICLTSCAVSMDNTYKTRDYNDPVFANNYYRVKEESITKNISKTVNFELEKNIDSVFETYEELKTFGSDFDSDVANNNVTYDSILHFNSNTTYGDKNKLGNIDDSFNHGILSKLTDGLLFCDNKTYQGVRVQIDEDGFVHKYDKECLYADYFALSFKAGSDFTSPIYTNSATYDIKLKIKFYLQDGDKFIENVCSYTMTSVLRDRYYLFGFKLKKEMVFKLKGLGISYDLISSTEDASLDHCLHLYETLFVNSLWY